MLAQAENTHHLHIAILQQETESGTHSKSVDSKKSLLLDMCTSNYSTQKLILDSLEGRSTSGVHMKPFVITQPLATH